MFFLLTGHDEIRYYAGPNLSSSLLWECSLFNIPLSIHCTVRILCRYKTLVSSNNITSKNSISNRTTFFRPTS
nr:MAG TPA: hypothetical protein [Caudoviricetes sp.]